MKVASADIQMASSRVYSETREKSGNQTVANKQLPQETIVDKVTLSQQQVPINIDSMKTSDASSTSEDTSTDVSLLKGSLSFLKEIFSQILNIVKN
jgi:hypothetical protein